MTIMIIMIMIIIISSASSTGSTGCCPRCGDALCVCDHVQVRRRCFCVHAIRRSRRSSTRLGGAGCREPLPAAPRSGALRLGCRDSEPRSGRRALDGERSPGRKAVRGLMRGLDSWRLRCAAGPGRGAQLYAPLRAPLHVPLHAPLIRSGFDARQA